ncbi:MAG: hypothetical protein AB7F89_20010 [Pirellulaceae bacterium]
MAIALATVVLTGTVQLLAVVSQQRRTADHRLAARYIAENALEEAMARPWEELKSESPVTLPAEANSPAANPRPAVQLDIYDEGTGVRRIRVQVTWTSTAGTTLPPWTLVGWRYRQQEAR